MAYLGVKNGENYGLYYFASISVRDEIAQKIGDTVSYLTGEKSKALKDFNIKKSDIKDGRVLIELYRNMSENAYLGLEGTPYDGVYVFKRKHIRDREAKNFENVFLTMDKDEILKKYNLGESEIRDGGFLMGIEVSNWLKKNPKGSSVKNEESALVKEVEKVENSVKEEKVEENKPSAKQIISEGNLLHNMIDVVAKDHDIVEIKMSNSDVYRVALRSIFYTEPNFKFENCAMMDSANNVILKENMIDKMIENGEIVVVTPSKIKYGDGYATLRECDDPYSPNIDYDKHGVCVISHFIPEVTINVSQVVSVVGYDSYEEINMEKITKTRNALVFDYLISKYGKRK